MPFYQTAIVWEIIYCGLCGGNYLSMPKEQCSVQLYYEKIKQKSTLSDLSILVESIRDSYFININMPSDVPNP